MLIKTSTTQKDSSKFQVGKKKEKEEIPSEFVRIIYLQWTDRRNDYFQCEGQTSKGFFLQPETHMQPLIPELL